MKYFMPIVAALLLSTGCNKKVDEPKVIMPDTMYNPAVVRQKAIEAIGKDKMKTHKGTLETMANLPGPGPFPPHLLPVKTFTLVEETENSAIYTITSDKGAKAKVTLKRNIQGNDTSWIISPPEDIR